MKTNQKGMEIKISRNFNKFYHYVESLMKVWKEKSSTHKISVSIHVRSGGKKK